MAETVTTSNSSEDELFGHLKGLYFCFATELWEIFSFYDIKFLLLLYVTKYHLFSDGEGLEVLGAYAGLVYELPVIGGILAGTILTQTIKIQDLAEPEYPDVLYKKLFGFITTEHLIYIVSILSLSVIWLVIQHEPMVLAAQQLMM